MHVVVAYDKTEEQQLHVVCQVELRHIAILPDDLGYLLMRTLVFIFRGVQCQLAHVFHIDFLTISCAVDAPSDIAELPIGQTNETMRHNNYFCRFGKVHGQILIFGQLWIILGLWLENIITPKTYYRQTAASFVPAKIQ